MKSHSFVVLRNTLRDVRGMKGAHSGTGHAVWAARLAHQLVPHPACLPSLHVSSAVCLPPPPGQPPKRVSLQLSLCPPCRQTKPGYSPKFTPSIRLLMSPQKIQKLLLNPGPPRLDSRWRGTLQPHWTLLVTHA